MLETLKVKLLTPTARIPTRNLSTDAGLDLYSDETTYIPLGKTVKVLTGIAIDVPPGYVGKIEDRSSMASKGLRTGAGVVDTGYQGELSIVLHNFSGTNAGDSNGKEGYVIAKGDKIAQILLYKVELPDVEIVISFPKSERGSNGFGSSGS